MKVVWRHLRWMSLIVGVVAAWAIQAAPPAIALPDSLPHALVLADIQTVPWTLRADRFRGQWGDEKTLYCPPSGAIAPIWGSDIYSDNSSICTAAVHAGLITLEEGGAIAIRILPGQSSYTGRTQNEIASSDFDRWPGSFTFTTLRDFVADIMPTEAGVLPVRVITWQTTAALWRDRLDQPFAAYCPAGGSTAPTWGSDIYRDASSICTAAVHAGLITPQRGGAIAFKMVSRMPFYIGNTRNGVTTRHWMGGDGSFSFIRESP